MLNQKQKVAAKKGACDLSRLGPTSYKRLFSSEFMNIKKKVLLILMSSTVTIPLLQETILRPKELELCQPALQTNLGLLIPI